MSSITRYTPRYIRPGATILSTTRCIVGGVLLTGKTAQVSLSIHDLATSVGYNSSTTRRLFLMTKGTGSVQFALPMEFSTGCAVSLSGAGGVATVLISKRR